MLTWQSEFETGFPLVDGQHKILIDKINKLEFLIKGPTINKPEVDSLVNFLASYTATHFKFEERCMELHHCPAFAQNKTAHEQFLAVVTKFKIDYAAQGPTRENIGKLHELASSWIKNHILKIDMQLKPCKKAAA